MNRDSTIRLCCPDCRGSLQLTTECEVCGEIETGTLECMQCGLRYPILNGVPRLVTKMDEDKSREHWLGDRKSSRLRAHLWYILSNVIGLIFSPLLAIIGWSLDLCVVMRGQSAPFMISDVRGLLWWHVRRGRPYNHLRMLEHALALQIIRREVGNNDQSCIVDIGAERSLFCSYLAKLGYKTLAMDLDAEQMVAQRVLCLKLRRSVRQSCDFVVASATRLPLRDNSAHLSVISVVEHIEDDKGAFAEFGRVIGDKHVAVISFLYQDFPLVTGQAERAWQRAREYHPAYGVPRCIQEYILAPSQASIQHETYFWKSLCRRVKWLVRITKVFEHSIIFDYFIYTRFARLEEVVYPGKQANIFQGKLHPFQWIFALKRS